MTDKEVFQGDDKTYELTVVDDADPPVAVAITGFTIKFTVKEFKTDTTNKIQKTTADAAEILITDGPNGLAEIYLVPADTAVLSGEFFYDIEVTNLSSKIYTIATGRFTIKLDIT